MQDSRIANYIVFDLEQQHKMPYNYQMNKRIISSVVEGWDKKIYVVPQRALDLWHKERKKYTLM